ncbi:NADP-dependent oxidoreductase [Paenibacillus sp. FJAT-27812]|uniref:NADP-dependent oxidoreductase n=1 Tax=Paenibacillus sp. FJAT-27812 TaxID=1684143 RepID=UPI0006A7DA78|nr:NADP-dependent oxidoreductase [Paenibacillus sp. FJAT-27812]
MTAKMMQAIQYHQFGGPEVLQLEQIPRPVPAAGEVLIRVHAAGVLPVDWKIRTGKFPMPIKFPCIPGTALSGVVEEIGPGVTALQKGQAVFGRSTAGAYAEYATAKAEALARKPDSLSFDEAATISGGATTAWQALIHEGGLKAGDRVLIHGAAGGVGLFAVQFAKWKGAHIIATCGTDNVGFVRSLGANEVIDYTESRFEEHASQVDLLLDTVGGDTLARSWSVVRKGGTLVSIAGKPAPDRAEQLGVRILRPSLPGKAQLEEIAALMDKGCVQTFIQQALPLTDAQLAHERSQIGHGRGRIVLHITD